MKKVYLDNAATTQIRSEVIEEMINVMKEDYGNPSSTHSFGRSAKNVIELSRKKIASLMNASAQEIIFTSGGTEAINWILKSAIQDLSIERIITSKMEHHAVLHTVAILEKEFGIKVDFVKNNENGEVNISHLTELLSKELPTLVSLMHVNNEIGTVLNLELIGRICKQYNAYFHSDTVQSIGKTAVNFKEMPVDFMTASAHKFHGPKGIGFAIVRKGINLKPIFFGGEQEKGLRAGTESVHNIAGMSKALEYSYLNLEEDRRFISNLKQYFIKECERNFPGFKVNGSESGFYNIINVSLPIPIEKSPLILFQLDMKGIAVSRGSACQSGSSKPSHVLAEILDSEDIEKPSLRISFCHNNTTDEIDYLIQTLKSI